MVLFGESKEVIGGYCFIVAGSLQEAAEIAKGNPCMNCGLFHGLRPIDPQRATAFTVTNETPTNKRRPAYDGTLRRWLRFTDPRERRGTRPRSRTAWKSAGPDSDPAFWGGKSGAPTEHVEDPATIMISPATAPSSARKTRGNCRGLRFAFSASCSTVSGSSRLPREGNRLGNHVVSQKKPLVETFSRAYAAASPDEQAALRHELAEQNRSSDLEAAFSEMLHELCALVTSVEISPLPGKSVPLRSLVA